MDVVWKLCSKIVVWAKAHLRLSGRQSCGVWKRILVLINAHFTHTFSWTQSWKTCRNWRKIYKDFLQPIWVSFCSFNCHVLTPSGIVFNCPLYRHKLFLSVFLILNVDSLYDMLLSKPHICISYREYYHIIFSTRKETRSRLVKFHLSLHSSKTTTWKMSCLKSSTPSRWSLHSGIEILSILIILHCPAVMQSTGRRRETWHWILHEAKALFHWPVRRERFTSVTYFSSSVIKLWCALLTCDLLYSTTEVKCEALY